MIQNAIVVSPHFDDAALSCGGGITRLVHAGTNVSVVTVFTADAPAGHPLSALARRCHDSWGVGDQPFALRQLEDDAALAVLGTAAERLGLLDAIYRSGQGGAPLYRYPLSPPTEFDAARTVPLIEAGLRASAAFAAEPDVVFCPIGFGGHPDHLLTRVAIQRIVDPRRIVYYDEFPYFIQPGVSDNVVGPPMRILPLTDAEVEKRIDSVACYTSQLRGLFPSGFERLREIASAHTPGSLFVHAPEPERSQPRMAERVRRAIAEAGGERYRIADGTPWPFLTE